MGGGVGDRANDAPCDHGALRHARRSETNSGARPPESEENHGEEGAERERPAEGLAEKMAAEIRRFLLLFEAGRTEIVRVGTAEWQTRLYRNEALMAAVLCLPEPPDFFQPFLNALFQAAIRGEIIAPSR